RSEARGSGNASRGSHGDQSASGDDEAGRRQRAARHDEASGSGQAARGEGETVMRRLPLVVLFAPLLLAGCASAPRKTEPTAAPAPETAVPEAKFARDPGGFTITQTVAVPSEARSEFETGVRLMQQERWEPAVAALLKATEKAPALLAAQIDLGI